MSNRLGRRIRTARQARGWTQKDLAAKVGRSQALVSMLESGTIAPRKLIDQVERVLADVPAAAPTLPLPDVPAFEPPSWTADEQLGVPLKVEVWKRPPAGGDFSMVVPAPPDAVLVLAGDIAGHGPRAAGPGLAVRGWVHGWMQAQLAPPRLDSFLVALSRALERLKLDVALFAALIRLDRSGRHTVEYEAASCGYPAPLLIAGPPYRTLESAEIGPPLPLGANDRVTVKRIAGLTAPWRLVAASDGLLARLGSGRETDGLRVLREWQCGTRRERPAAQELGTGSPARDDESTLIVSWSRWDMVTSIDTAHDGIRHDTIDRVVEAARRATDDALAARLRAILVEALANVRTHARSNQNHAIVGYRATADGVRLHVTDFGERTVTPGQIATSGGGFAVMRKMASHLEVRQGENGGTLVDIYLEWRSA